MPSSYQPFPITEFKTGLFNYLEPWIRPQDAFDPMTNAFVYRGTLNKRSGYSFYGYMAYRDAGVSIKVGTGVANYSGTLAKAPIRAGSLVIATGGEFFSDNGDGTLTGTGGGTGTINYTTGAWSINSAFVVGIGVVIRGYYTYVPQLQSAPPNLPIMAIKQYINESTNVKSVVVCDTRRASVYNPTTNEFDPISSVSQQIWQGDGATVAISINTGWTNLAQFTIRVTDGTTTVADNGLGAIGAGGNFAAGSTVNYTTGVLNINFVVAPASTVTVTASFDLQGDYFTGDETNFFNSTNWLSQLYLTNNKDRVTLFNGSTLSRPPFPITQSNKNAFVNDIATCLDVKVYKNRLLLLRPIVLPSSSPSGQSIRYSAINNATNFVADIAGNGGELSAPTSDWIQTSQFLRDVLIVFFENTTWTFRFTGSASDPFRFDKINNSKSTQAPYGSIDYDQRVTSMGAKGLIACDGVNVDRYDIKVIDHFLDINQEKFGQCFAQRFDTLNQSWMLYPSEETDAQKSDRALIYNFLEDTWSTYNIALSCLGLALSSQDVTWSYFASSGSNPLNWNQAEFSWNSYLSQDLAPILLGGTHTGAIVKLNDGDTDNGTVIESSITSTKWNPFVKQGLRIQLGYIDFYYQINADAVLTLSFYVNNSTNVATTRTLTLDGPVNDDTAMKRIPINLVGEFVRMNISESSNANYKILGMVLWASPAGRLTP